MKADKHQAKRIIHLLRNGQHDRVEGYMEVLGYNTLTEFAEEYVKEEGLTIELMAALSQYYINDIDDNDRTFIYNVLKEREREDDDENN